jgi:hypothetical protein
VIFKTASKGVVYKHKPLIIHFSSTFLLYFVFIVLVLPFDAQGAYLYYFRNQSEAARAAYDQIGSGLAEWPTDGNCVGIVVHLFTNKDFGPHYKIEKNADCNKSVEAPYYSSLVYVWTSGDCPEGTEPNPDNDFICESPSVPKNMGKPEFCPVDYPINPANGNKYQIEADYSSPLDKGLHFIRYYNSLTPGPGALGAHELSHDGFVQLQQQDVYILFFGKNCLDKGVHNPGLYRAVGIVS